MRQQPQTDKKETTAILPPLRRIKLVMWSFTVVLLVLGTVMVFKDEFVVGSVWMAAGLMMCPRINETMKFGPRFGLMVLLFIIGFFLR